ncbi:hypothetical protein cypCar_00047083 [Cyprinus carpio]|nr:hypothetical protein cypCar_00047083 [Cyprinus carpio]
MACVAEWVCTDWGAAHDFTTCSCTSGKNGVLLLDAAWWRLDWRNHESSLLFTGSSGALQVGARVVHECRLSVGEAQAGDTELVKVGRVNGTRTNLACSSHRMRRGKTGMKMKIGTHNGTFHCDEVLACFLLRQLPEYKDAEILRSRDASLLKQCDVVVDVGGEYDPSQQRYDHHQRYIIIIIIIIIIVLH